MSYRFMTFFKRRFKSDKKVLHEVRFKIQVSSDNKDVFLRVQVYEASINWGDGVVKNDIYAVRTLIHRYEKPGIYEVCLWGKGIVDLSLANSNLISLDVTKCPKLEFLDCSNNQITELDLRNCKGVYEVYCSMNKMRELKLSKHKELFYLACSINELKSLDLSGCPKLIVLRCRKNYLHQLDIAQCHKLVVINLEQNKFNDEEILIFQKNLPKRFIQNEGYFTFENNAENEHDSLKEQ